MTGTTQCAEAPTAKYKGDRRRLPQVNTAPLNKCRASLCGMKESKAKEKVKSQDTQGQKDGQPLA